LFDALRDIAAAADLEALDELAASLGASRRLGKGVSEVLAEHERSLRDDERNRLVGSASMVQPKLAAILAGIYLPEFVSARDSAPLHRGNWKDLKEVMVPMRKKLERLGWRTWKVMRDERGLTTWNTSSAPR